MTWFDHIYNFLQPWNISCFLNEHLILAYVVIVVWTFFEGETIVILAGIASKDGTPNPFGVVLAAPAGSMLGDQTWFFLGRLKGKAIIARRPSWQEKAQRVYDMLNRHHTWLILGFRFLYGLRTITPLAIGMTEIPTKRFILLNLIGAVIWANVFTWGGFFLGHGIEWLFEKHKFFVLAGLGIVILVVWLVRVVLRKRRARRMMVEGQQEEKLG